MGEKSLWVSILQSKYRSFSFESVNESGARGWFLWWKDLHELWWDQVGRLFRDKISLSLGDGGVFRFWHDPWVEGSVSLKSCFSKLFNLSSQKSACVCEFFSKSKNVCFFQVVKVFLILMKCLSSWIFGFSYAGEYLVQIQEIRGSGSSPQMVFSEIKRCTVSLLGMSHLQKNSSFLGRKFGGKLFR